MIHPLLTLFLAGAVAAAVAAIALIPSVVVVEDSFVLRFVM